ncbi:hypothetical protein, partial [Psychrobacter pasteurii]|uniref:hypothetical protein n=1 Tax=Psychrobacter pasteurii TaxID=1945520 RepID=UPI001ABF7BEA
SVNLDFFMSKSPASILAVSFCFYVLLFFGVITTAILTPYCAYNSCAQTLRSQAGATAFL